MKQIIPFLLFLISFLTFSQPNTEVFLFDLNIQNEAFELSNFKNISNNEGYDNQPSFMDDTTILFASTRNGQTDILKYSILDGSKEWLCDTEGSEYSPVKIPIQNAVSAIRLDIDGKQFLYRYDLENGQNKVLIDNLVVGYHTWLDQNTIIASVLQGDIMSVYILNLLSGISTKIDENVGRSLHEIPFEIPKNVYLKPVPRHFTYVDKKSTPWNIMSYGLNHGKIEKITDLLPEVEDMVWLNSTILIGKGSKLFSYQSEKIKNWKEIADLESFGITNITRLAVSHDGKKLAVVGEKIEDLTPQWPQKKETQLIEVKKASQSPTIDGVANESIWNETSWHPMDQRWIGEAYNATDFQGRYKLTWTEDSLYILAEIKDDTIFDQYQDPLKLWWDDDCVEVFIDEDNSGGDHQYNYNAFAYHVALDGNVVDMSPEKVGKLYNEHLKSKHVTTGNTTIWELKLSIYDDSYKDEGDNKPVKLKVGKKIGFAIAYCDNDGSVERENFIGSIPVEGADKNQGWIDANIFGTIELKN